MTTTQQPRLTDYPAFRLQRGDLIRYGNRVWEVASEPGLAYRFARGRHEISRSVLKVTLTTPAARSGNRTLSGRRVTITLEHCDTVRKYR
jgi:hypothetical protein